VLAAKKNGIPVSNEEVQERTDQLRRVRGLHRAKDTLEFLNAMQITLDEFEDYIRDTLYREKMMKEITKPTAIEEYFKLNSSKFDRIEISHIVVDSEGKAREIMALVSEEPDSFAEIAKANSIADTAANGGVVGRVLRGILPREVESKVFNAAVGEVLGPFQFGDGARYEIFKVNAKDPAKLDEETSAEVRQIVFNEWLKAQSREYKIEIA
jgi:parvulin-like peptidyl-prolyl isomerase